MLSRLAKFRSGPILLACCWLLSCSLGGCSRWQARETAPRKPNPFATQALRAKPGTVHFELAIAQLDQDQEPTLELAWREFDEQAVSVDTRRWWDRNGLRVAVISSQIPDTLLELVAPREVNEDYLDEFQLQLFHKGKLDSTPRLVMRKQVGIRPTEPKWVAVSNPLSYGQWRWTTSAGSQTSQGEAVQTGFMVSSQARGDGSVTVKLVPRIASGAPKPSFGLSQWQLELEHKQDEVLLWDLAIEVTLLPGQTIVATSNYPESSDEPSTVDDAAATTWELGQLFFETLENQSAHYIQPGPRVFLLRLMGSANDDLFQMNVSQ